MDNLPEARLYIDGKLRAAAGNRTYDNICPWTGEVIGKAADASADDVNEAIAAARRAFDQTDWSQKHEERFALMKKYRDLLFANRDKLVADRPPRGGRVHRGGLPRAGRPGAQRHGRRARLLPRGDVGGRPRAAQ